MPALHFYPCAAAGPASASCSRARPGCSTSATAAVEIDRLAAGGVFAGESLLSGLPYSYQAYATSDCAVLLLSKAAFDDWLSAQPALVGELRQAAASHERRAFLESSFLAQVLERTAIDAAAAAASDVTLAPGEHLITEGQPARSVYVVRAGRLRLSRGAAETVGFVEAGDLVEETGTIPGFARQASFIAETECRIHAIAADVFRGLVTLTEGWPPPGCDDCRTSRGQGQRRG